MIKWDEPRDLNVINNNNVESALKKIFPNTSFDIEELKGLTGSEAVWAFFGWLSRRDDVVSIGGDELAGELPSLIKEFCRVNDLKEPRKGWDYRARYPDEE